MVLLKVDLFFSPESTIARSIAVSKLPKSSTNKIPNEYTSHFSLYIPVIISGARYRYVPTSDDCLLVLALIFIGLCCDSTSLLLSSLLTSVIAVSLVMVVVEIVVVVVVVASIVASPKSPILMIPSLVTNTLLGLISR